jgi:hypothetical protein
MKLYLRYLFSILFGVCYSFCLAQAKGLEVFVTAKLPSSNIVARYEGYDKGGNTSIAFDAENIFKWSGASPYKAEPHGYFNKDNHEVAYIKRDRDLGQTFTYTGNVPKKLMAITVSTGYGTNVVRSKMYGRNVSVQIFQVTGRRVLDDNGSDSTMKAFHGFPHNRYTDSISHIRDDYYIGEVYNSLAVLSGAIFPSKMHFGFSNNEADVSPDDPLLKGKYLRFVFPENNKLSLKPGKKYAFLIMIDSMCNDCGFTLANNYMGKYNGGHGIRRDGKGRFPPVAADPTKDFFDSANVTALAAAHFPKKFLDRIKIAPGTNGYPDVDTWRDLFFIIEAK